MLRFLKDWTLPVAIVLGTLCYLLFYYVPALDAAGNPIEGLYVAGDCSGGYFDASYPNLLAGAAAGRSVTFGRLAGKNAVHR